MHEQRGSALRAEGVSVRYGGVKALTGVSLTVEPGQVYGVIGPNGAGKTTLFDAICGTAPASGRVWLGDREISRASALKRARLGIRRTFQRQQAFGGLTVHDNLLVSLEWRGGNGGVLCDVAGVRLFPGRERARRQRVTDVMELCALTALADTPAENLPIGQLRLLELARAIVDEPGVLLLDEPTSGLQTQDVSLLGSVIDDIKARQATAALLIEHDVAFVMQHSDRVLALNLGSVLADATPLEIQAHADVRSAYLG
jgi:branched-chain amino acid transport system ATP-binding protein